MRGLAGILVTVVLGGWSQVAAAEETPPTNLDDCAARVRVQPHRLESYRCFRQWTRRTGQHDETLAYLDTVVSEAGSDPRLDLYRGWILIDDGRSDDAISHLEAAAAGCRENGLATCEILALTLPAKVHTGWPTAARDRALERAAELARESNDSSLGAWVDSARGWIALSEGKLTDARLLLGRAWEVADPDGPYDLRVSALNGLGTVAWYTNRISEARAIWSQQLELELQAGDAAAAVGTTYNVMLAQLNLSPKDHFKDYSELQVLLDEAIAAARAVSDRATELRFLVLQAQTYSDSSRRRDGWAEVLEMAEQLDDLQEQVRALRQMAFEGFLTDRDTAKAEELMRRAEHHAASPDLESAWWVRIWTCADRAQLFWITDRWSQAKTALDGCLDLIDLQRSRQDLPVDRARTQSRFADVYTIGADAALSIGNEPETALAWLERGRARSLAEELAAPGLAKDPELEEVRRELRQLQRALVEETGGQETLAALARLERSEAEILARLRAVAPAPAVPSLSEIQAELRDDELILLYSVSWRSDLWDSARGSWVLALTARELQAYPVSPEDELEPAVEALVGLTGRDDSTYRRAAVRLYDTVLGDVRRYLADHRRVIVVPDGALHQLPIGMLRPTADAEPLVTTHSFERVPSLGVWLERRRASTASVREQVVAVADPGDSTRAPERLRSAGLTQVGRLGPLQHAAREAQRVARAYRPRSILLTGEEATETALRAALDSPPAILHFATHAVVDTAQPQRSAILLAADDKHDGLLQPRDIVELPVEGTLVILSACSAAGGELVAGEGILGLARAFLVAGAGAVVGFLGPVDDQGAAVLMDRFFRKLRRGSPAAEALAKAQAELARSGYPARVWSRAVLIGDGHRTWPAPQPSPALPLWLGGVTALAVAVLATGYRLRRRRSDGRKAAS